MYEEGVSFETFRRRVSIEYSGIENSGIENSGFIPDELLNIRLGISSISCTCF